MRFALLVGTAGCSSLTLFPEEAVGFDALRKAETFACESTEVDTFPFSTFFALRSAISNRTESHLHESICSDPIFLGQRRRTPKQVEAPLSPYAGLVLSAPVKAGAASCAQSACSAPPNSISRAEKTQFGKAIFETRAKINKILCKRKSIIIIISLNVS